jgi:DNA-binding CsgD family transcriptional regulator/tetratricopeptide (TPR) repeat protein/CBS domain-containing protein
MSDRSSGHAGTALPDHDAPAAFIGRDRDLARLLDAYEASASGSPRVAVVAGEAGIGKSRVVSELAAEVERRDGRVMVGACLDLADGGLPLLPLAEALRGLARTTPWPDLEGILGPLRPQLAGLVPTLGEDGSGTDEPLAPARMSEGLLAILGRLAADRPTLLVFEDVHWIDRASRDLVTFLARNLATEPMLIVLTWRTDDVDPDTERWLVELARQDRVERIDLSRFDRAAVRAQMVSLLGAEPDPPIVERVWRRSDGNPYFVEELAAAGDEHAPPTLAASVTARLALLSPRTRDVVRIAAVGGRSIDEGLLVAVADSPVTDVREAIHEAVEHRVLVVGDDGRIGFRHALVREVAAGELLGGERRDLHERLATVLSERSELAEPSPAGAAAELAYHWEGAGRSVEALEAAIEAGAAAARVAAWADADRQYERALRLADAAPLPDGIDRVELLRRSAEAAEFAGDLRRAQELVDRALAEAEDAGERVALLHARHGYLRWTQGDNDGSLAAYERGLALVPKKPPSAARARIQGSLAGALLGLGRYDEGRRTATDGVASAEAAGARPEEARARNVLGSLLVALGEVDEGLEQLERSATLAAEAGPSDMRVVAPYNLAVNLALAGRLREAQDAAARGVEAARTEGLERRYGMDLAALEGDVLTRLGRWDDAAEVMDAGIALDPSGRGTIYLATARGRLEGLRGDVATARRWFAVADDLAQGQIDADLAGYLARARAEAALIEGNPDDALEIARAGLVPLEGTDDHFVRSPLLVLAIQAAADVAEAARAAQDEDAVAVAAAPSAVELEAQQAAAPMVAALRAHAVAEASRLEGSSSPERWTDTAARFAEIPDPFGVAYARYREAEATLRRDGVKADVGSLLRDAADGAAELGALPLYRSIETLARRARVQMERPEPVEPEAEPDRRPAGLSPREIEVLRLVADGRSNGEIGDALFITRKTAGVHVTHILDKLGVANRVEAAMAASRLGLLDDPGEGP